jgi:ABC-type glycerol-3-phosphate transport system substrate-binding protein
MKILRAVLLTLLLATVFAACGGGNGPNPSPTTYGSAAASLI